MKSPVKAPLMRILLDGNSHREIDLATGVGFTKVATIRKWLDSFERAGFITREKNEGASGYSCRLNCNRETIMKIYNYLEFQHLRPDIRNKPWFCPLFTRQFEALHGELPDLIDAMVRASHTFFETICHLESPAEIEKIYRQTLLVNQLAGFSSPEFDEICIYYQIFLHSVIRDIRYGGLGEGFADVLGMVQHALSRSAAEFEKQYTNDPKKPSGNKK
ncbi:MAG: hypothetical protein D5R99_08095 [Methanocalculus sp. MSAO_Arc1]|uniref:hypothetical protein n=1 Tax=Methanocalculus TaxID=71151 RepID=UPI000FF5A828|nr:MULTISPECIES: hypothetical protein [unclassified Methanocalculus]MCP1662429.1 DNA-binding transcriptional regulator YhcF (GntR family) [Methanocalculus sp. AMF5]RQD79493.1 MAG: hypothetical protein D5R99_08095 [Methanocalculus sp. MSAO_Arc1]